MKGTEAINNERGRQILECGHTVEKDDEHSAGDMLECAIQIAEDVVVEIGGADRAWPRQRAQHVKEKYKTDFVKRLAIAGALIAAEIDRYNRKRVVNSTSG